MDNKGQVPMKKARNEGTEGPTVHVAPSGTLSVELADLVPYFLPTEEEVRSYLPTEEEVRSYLPTEEEVRGYIQGARDNIGRG